MTSPHLHAHSFDGGVSTQQPILWPPTFNSPTHHRRGSYDRATFKRQLLTQPSSAASSSFKEGATLVAPTTPPSARKTHMSFSQPTWQPWAETGPGSSSVAQDKALPSSSQASLNGVRQLPAPGPPPQIYTAQYSGVDVYEMQINNLVVMRRRRDSWLNATQILKVAGMEKGKRTKVLEKEVLNGEHEKIQGGYGKFQGTWVSYERGVGFCRQYGVEALLRPLLEYDMGQDGVHGPGRGLLNTPTKEQAHAAQRRKLYRPGAENRPGKGSSDGTFFKNISSTASTAVAAINKARSDSSVSRPLTAKRSSQQMNASHESSQNGDSQQSAYSQAMAARSLYDEDMMDVSVGTQNAHLLHKRSNQNMSQDHLSFHDRGQNSSSYHDMTQENGDMNERPLKKMRSTLNLGVSMQSHDTLYDTCMTEVTPTELNDSFTYQEDPFRVDDHGAVALPPLPEPKDVDGERTVGLLKDLLTEDEHGGDYSNHEIWHQISGPDLDLPIDLHANTALHWAASLALLPLVRLLIEHGANIYRVNQAGETALMRACISTNNFDAKTFPDLLEILSSTIEMRDGRGQTLLHHIVLTSAVESRLVCNKYYLESLLEFVVRRGSASASQHNSFDALSSAPNTKTISLGHFMSEVVNAQDKAGDTALNIAARTGNERISNQLLEIGANPSIRNRSGWVPLDFGVGEGAGDMRPPPKKHLDVVCEAIDPALEACSRDATNSFTQVIRDSQDNVNQELAKLQEHIHKVNSDVVKASTASKAAQLRRDDLQRQVSDRIEMEKQISNLSANVNAELARLGQAGISGDDLPMNIGDADGGWEIKSEGIPQAVLSGDIGQPLIHHLDQKQISYIESLPSVTHLRLALSVYMTNNARLRNTVAELKQCQFGLERDYGRLVATCAKEAMDPDTLEKLVVAVDSEGMGPVNTNRVENFLRNVHSLDQ